ncbi:MAG: DUF5107 domain-containing protein [Phycisphaerae bacterium]
MGNSRASIRQAPLVLPTYPLGRPDPCPLFYAGRSYQGARGPVYPLAMLDRLSVEKEDRAWQAVYLENRYVELVALPQIGGRLFAGRDKTNGYDFIYRQSVIKPALIGMAGAWISGGAEWDLPHHHRASTFMPSDYRLIENADGSATLVVGEIEPRHRMKWLVATTLRPDSSLVETAITLVNRTPLTNSFLCFTNLAVHVNENYQVIFPPSVQWGTQHAKREFISWPIGRQRYANVDFTAGVDVSWWKNHPSHISIFAWGGDEDFFGGYDHGRHAGTVHVADHHVAPGKKFFTWGSGTTGAAWDRILTDGDGPYVELMAGVYSDNQPDYSWIGPYETKTVKSYWYPVRELGGIKNASTDAAVNLEVGPARRVRMAFNTTREHRGATVLLQCRGKVVFHRRIDISPDRPFAHEMPLPRGASEVDFRAAVQSADGRELVSYNPVRRKPAPMPEVVTPIPTPDKIKTNEELYLAGLRVEQFHNHALEPYPYYEEALRRDGLDSRTNTALGILYLKRGMFEQARAHLQTAVRRLTARYTRPRDGEPHYYLGLALRWLGDRKAARDALNRAAWNMAWRSSAHYVLAEMALEDGDFGAATDFVDQCLALNADSTKALDLKAILLRKADRLDEADALTAKSLAIDPLDFLALNERILTSHGRGRKQEVAASLAALGALMGGKAQSYLELAYDYVHCGMIDEAIGVLNRIGESADPMVHYTLGHLLDRKDDTAGANRAWRRAGRLPPDYCFPHRLESIGVLQEAMRRNGRDARAPYYLGNLLYDIQPLQAMAAWEESRRRDGKFAMVHRNLAIAYARFDKNVSRAVASMKKAVALDGTEPRFFAELDALLEAQGAAPRSRLAIMEKNAEVVAQRDDALTRRIALHVRLGHYDKALELLAGHHFHVWEGAERKVHDLYVDACLAKGRELAAAAFREQALKQYQHAALYPANFEFGRPYDRAREAEVYHFIGLGHEALGERDQARKAFRQSLERDRAGTPMAYWQGLSCLKLGDRKRARSFFDGLVRAGRNMLRAGSVPDFFAIAGNPKQGLAPAEQGHYLVALGLAGKGDVKGATAEIRLSLAANPNFMPARIMLERLR